MFVLFVFVPANLQFAGAEFGDLQSLMFAIASMASAFRFGDKGKGFHLIAQVFLDSYINPSKTYPFAKPCQEWAARTSAHSRP